MTPPKANVKSSRWARVRCRPQLYIEFEYNSAYLLYPELPGPVNDADRPDTHMGLLSLQGVKDRASHQSLSNTVVYTELGIKK